MATSSDSGAQPGSSPKLTMIVARAHGGVVGKDGGMPWHIPADLKYFKAQTIGKAVIMGRRTYESIGRTLPNRLNIIVSRTLMAAPEGCIVSVSIEDALAIAAENDMEPIIIGGGALYAACLPQAAKVFVTEIDLTVKGDTFFPDLDPGSWHLASEEAVAATTDQPALRFCTYIRT